MHSEEKKVRDDPNWSEKIKRKHNHSFIQYIQQTRFESLLCSRSLFRHKELYRVPVLSQSPFRDFTGSDMEGSH